jgi:hypothetical protein
MTPAGLPDHAHDRPSLLHPTAIQLDRKYLFLELNSSVLQPECPADHFSSRFGQL